MCFLFSYNLTNLIWIAIAAQQFQTRFQEFQLTVEVAVFALKSLSEATFQSDAVFFFFFSGVRHPGAFHRENSMSFVVDVLSPTVRNQWKVRRTSISSLMGAGGDAWCRCFPFRSILVMFFSSPHLFLLQPPFQKLK